MVQYSGSAPDGTSLAVRANFPLNATKNLVVNLSNIIDVLDPADILPGLGFMLLNRSTLVNLTPAALLMSGNTVFYDPDGQPAGANVVGEWGITFQGTRQGVPNAGSRISVNPNFSGPDPAFPAVTASDTDSRNRGQSRPRK
jgi:hypothetical protein